MAEENPRRRPHWCLFRAFKVFRTIFWFNVSVLLYVSVAAAPAFLRHLQKMSPHQTIESIHASATIWYIILVAMPIVVVYYTHNVRRWV